MEAKDQERKQKISKKDYQIPEQPYVLQRKWCEKIASNISPAEKKNIFITVAYFQAHFGIKFIYCQFFSPHSIASN